MPQIFNAELVKNLSAHFAQRNEPNFAIGNALSGLLSTPRLRAQYAFSSDHDDRLYDLSGQGRALDCPGNHPGVSSESLSGYISFVKASSQYYQRLTEPGLEITDYLTLWTWVRFQAASTGAATYLLSKWYTATNERSFVLYKTAGDVLTFGISTDGTAEKLIGDGGVEYAEDTWLFIAGRFTPSAAIDLYIGNSITGTLNIYTNAAAIPASLFACTEPFEVGRGNRTNYLEGYLAYFGLSAFTEDYTGIFNKFYQARPLFMW